MTEENLVYRLRKRAEIRRQIPTRKSVQEGAADRIADLLEEAANEIERLEDVIYQMQIDQAGEDWQQGISRHMKAKDTLEKAYGNIPKEPLLNIEFELPFRGLKYYWLKLVRKIQGR